MHGSTALSDSVVVHMVGQSVSVEMLLVCQDSVSVYLSLISPTVLRTVTFFFFAYSTLLKVSNIKQKCTDNNMLYSIVNMRAQPEISRVDLFFRNMDKSPHTSFFRNGGAA